MGNPEIKGELCPCDTQSHKTQPTWSCVMLCQFGTLFTGFCRLGIQATCFPIW